MKSSVKIKFFPCVILLLVFSCTLSNTAPAQTKTIHVFVALCDNEFQGIVPVPGKIGNGKDAVHNLYWGAGYGVKNFFKNKTTDWELIKVVEMENPIILERILFKHTTEEIYLLADAFDGEKIKPCIEYFLKACNGQEPILVNYNSTPLNFGGKADLIAYVGHNGLMDFSVNINYRSSPEKKRDVIILACYSKNLFSPEIKKANANPVLWTTHLMAPEAYTLKSGIDGWILGESATQIDERAAQTYNQYQKCGIRGARNLFTSGF
jgi:hypothetical protein